MTPCSERWRASAVAVALGAALLLAAPPAHAGDAEDAAREGHTAYDARRFREAASYFELAITFDGTKADYYYWASMSHSAAMQDSDAYEWIRGALSLKDDDPRYHVQHGRACLFMGMPGESVMAFENALELAPGDARLWVEYGTVLKQSGHPYQGMEALRKALAMDATIPGLAFDLGLVLMELGDPEQAVGPLRQATTADPRCAECQLMLGDALLDSGQPRAALGAFEAVLRLVPDDYRARQRGVRACYALADFGCAETHRRALQALFDDDKVFALGDRKAFEVDRFEVRERTARVYEFFAGEAPPGVQWSFLITDPSGWQEAELVARVPPAPVAASDGRRGRTRPVAGGFELVRLAGAGGEEQLLERWSAAPSYPTVRTAVEAALAALPD